MGLEEYRRKRRFDQTPEPAGKVAKRAGKRFVIQKHRATRLHYDFRLEMEGVLRSWAIPKGPSFNPAEKRLAIQTEDHPIDYGGFEGIIPPGNYGAGKVIIWDQGTYEMIDPKTPEEGSKKGKLHLVLKGKKLAGEWVIVRGSREPNQWIFFKVRDSYASADGDITEDRPESVISGKRVEEIGNDDASGPKGRRRTKQWITPIERELERYGMKEPGRVSIPRNVQPMLATLMDKPFDNDDWLFELKLDGIRAIVVKDGAKIEMWTRNGKTLTNRFPALARTAEELPADTAILDGEIVALDEKGRSRFEMIQPRIHLSRAKDVAEADETIPVYFYAFDLLYLNGFDLTRFPLTQRKGVLRMVIPQNDGWIRYADHVDGQGVDFFKLASKLGLEGIVAKLKSSEYQQTRSRYWRKIKTQHTDHFVVGGFTPPEGSRKYFGALLLGLYDRNGELIYVGRTGGGFDDRILAETYRQLRPLVRKTRPFKETPAEVRRATWIDPRLVCEVRFGEWTSDRKLRAPVFQGFRDDLGPEQCMLEESIPQRRNSEGNPGSTAAVNWAGNSRNAGDAAAKLPADPEFPSSVHRVELTNLDKLFWPGEGYTKGDLIRYYDRIAPHLIPHLRDRPLVFKRYPDGIHGDYFYQKDAPDHTPGWVRTHEIWSDDVERLIRYFVGADRDQLLYIANTGAITQNPWMSRIQLPDYPDYIVLDLDPVEAPFSTVQKVAIELKHVLDELNLRCYPKTSGASGMHLHLPLLEGKFTYQDVRTFAEAIARIVVQRNPDIATVERVVRRRKAEMVYVDFLQNVRGKTVASVYSPRAKPRAPVSTPLKWQEINKPLDPRDYTIRTIFDRLDKFGDLFEQALTDRQDISGFLAALKQKSR